MLQPKDMKRKQQEYTNEQREHEQKISVSIAISNISVGTTLHPQSRHERSMHMKFLRFEGNELLYTDEF